MTGVAKFDIHNVDIILTCTNHAAALRNMIQISQIQSREYSYQGKMKGQFSLKEDKLPSPLNLRLKVGSRVMFTRNDDQRRWVNGTLGVVQRLNARSISVRLASGVLCNVLPVTWETYKYVYDSVLDKIVTEKIGEYTQYPLMLAWAETIHKSQGKTLDRVPN